MPFYCHHYQLFAHLALKNSLLVSAVWLMIPFMLSFFHGTFSTLEHASLSHVSSSSVLPLNCHSLVFHVLLFSFVHLFPLPQHALLDTLLSGDVYIL